MPHRMDFVARTAWIEWSRTVRAVWSLTAWIVGSRTEWIVWPRIAWIVLRPDRMDGVVQTARNPRPHG